MLTEQAQREYLARIEGALTTATAVASQFMSGTFEVKDNGGRDVVTAADRAISDQLRRILLMPGEGWLSEEDLDDKSRLSHDVVWIVDPLDGTREFVDGIPEWSISVGLVVEGIAVAGGVCNPATGEMFLGSLDQGVTYNNQPTKAALRTNLDGALVLASRQEYGRGEWSRFEGREFSIKPTGSVAYKLALVSAGLADATWTLSPKHEWDVAAGVALMNSVGRHCWLHPQCRLAIQQRRDPPAGSGRSREGSMDGRGSPHRRRRTGAVKRPSPSQELRPAVVCVAGIARSIVLFSFMLLVACRSSQSSPYSLNGPALAAFAALEPIDAHTHVSQTGPAFIGMLERLHMHVLDILYVDDTDPNHASMESQKQDALNFVASSKGHAKLCTTFDPFQFNDVNFAKEAIKALNQDFADGAVAAKVWKNIGMEIKDGAGKYVLPDDPRLEPIYKDIAAHNRTVIIHAADPDVAWVSPDPRAAHPNYYAVHPEWLMSRKPGAPSKKQILDARDQVLALNPNLRVVGAHLGSMEGQLDDLANRFELYQNFSVDTAARVPGLTAQPRDKVRAFFLKYQDRILYGTDRHFYAGATDQAMAASWELQYALDWRYFATDDIFEYQGHRVEGLNLPPLVLRKLYHDNAVRFIPGIDATPH